MKVQAYWYKDAYVLRVSDDSSNEIHEEYLLVQESRLELRLIRSYPLMTNNKERLLIETVISNGEPTTIEDFVETYNRTVSHIREVANPIIPLNPKEPGYRSIGSCGGDIMFKEVTLLGVSKDAFLTTGNDYIKAYPLNNQERNYGYIPAEILSKYHNTIIDISEWLHKVLAHK